MDRFQGLTAFARVVETGSFARAAERLDVSVSAVSRQVAELESHLGARLLNRTTRRLSLTESGQAFYERCVQLLADLEEAEAAVSAATLDPRGTLRLTTGTTFGARYVAPVIAAYQALHPRVRFDIDLSDRIVDVVEEGFDLAVRIARLADSSLAARKLAPNHRVVCASPEYLARHGAPRSPEDLAGHICLTTSEFVMNWDYIDPDGAPGSVRVTGRHACDNWEVLREWALAGLGIALKSTWDVREQLENGSLVSLFPGYTFDSDVAIYAVYPHRRLLPAKTRAFIEFLADSFGPEPFWDRPPVAMAALRTRAERPKPRIKGRSTT